MSEFLPVEIAYLHEAAISHPLPAERTLGQSKCPGIKMKWSTQGLYWDYKGKQGLIPAPAIACAVFAPAPPPEEKKAALKKVG